MRQGIGIDAGSAVTERACNLQGDDDSDMVHVVEAMRLAAEDHERLLLECAILRARACSDDCVFDMDVDMTCPCGPAADLRPWIAV